MRFPDTQCIGVFDSGVGGLTVLKELVTRMPEKRYIYFGDLGRFPYGGKSQATIVRYAIENATILIDKGIECLVVACNTASSVAMDSLLRLRVPVLDVIAPVAERVISMPVPRVIGVIGTRATIGSGAYQSVLTKCLPMAKVVACACPLLVAIAEEPCRNQGIIRLIVKEYLDPLRAEGIDTLVLACTHYPLIASFIQEELGPNVRLVNPAEACAEVALKRYGKETSATYPLEEAFQRVQYFVSDDPDRFRAIGEAFLGFPMASLSQL